MLHQQLRTYTREEHTAMEKHLMERIRLVRTVNDYGQLLSIFYGFYASLEQLVIPFTEQMEIHDMQERRKAASLAADLLYFDVNLREVELCAELPPIKSFTQALGCLYVTEGSTLGGKIIARILSEKLQISSTNGFSFLLSYGENVVQMWEKFKIYLQRPFTAEQAEEVMGAANNTFITLKNWFNAHEPA
jgi:heme oxygenase